MFTTRSVRPVPSMRTPAHTAALPVAPVQRPGTVGRQLLAGGDHPGRDDVAGARTVEPHRERRRCGPRSPRPPSGAGVRRGHRPWWSRQTTPFSTTTPSGSVPPLSEQLLHPAVRNVHPVDRSPHHSQHHQSLHARPSRGRRGCDQEWSSPPPPIACMIGAASHPGVGVHHLPVRSLPRSSSRRMSTIICSSTSSFPHCGASSASVSGPKVTLNLPPALFGSCSEVLELGQDFTPVDVAASPDGEKDFPRSVSR